MLRFLTLISLFAMVISCRNIDEIDDVEIDDTEVEDTNNEDNLEPEDEIAPDPELYPDWDETTHSKNVEPDFDRVFANSEVLRFDITISSDNWNEMWDDLNSNLGNSGGGMGGGFPGGGQPGGGGGGMNSTSDYDPIWVPCTLNFSDTDWYQVGVRFKGNSSLSQATSSNNKKLSLKLDFDQFEDDYPELKNQRFYGFKQLNLNNNFNDESLMREKVAADLFRSFGMAAAHTAFCVVYINDDYYGVYTIVEEVDDTVVETQFSDNSGNLYKPDGDAATFKSGSYDTDELCLKTNTSAPDYSDAKALYDAINSTERTSNPTAWQESLESVFDVSTFLKWMASNAVIQNWDTYGNMTHNYYIYNNAGRLTWIPWDNNESLQSGTGDHSAIEVSRMGSVSSSWPLISYIYDVAEYEAEYKEYLRQFVDEVFITSQLQSLYDEYYNLLKPYAEAEESGRTFFDTSNIASEFLSAVSSLKNHAQSRVTVVNNYLE